MNLLVLSDLHLGPLSTDRNQKFLQLLSAAHASKDEVLILGDLFDLWFGNPSLTFPFQRPILEKMQELAAAGLAMDYVEGNRDFLVSKQSGNIFRNVRENDYTRSWGSRTLYAEHGDRINLDDRPYRFFRR